MAQTTDDESVKLISDKLLHFAAEMTVDELSVCFLYLSKLSVKMHTDVMITILELILKFIKNGEFVTFEIIPIKM